MVIVFSLRSLTTGSLFTRRAFSRSLSENYDFAGFYTKKWEGPGIRRDKVGKKKLDMHFSHRLLGRKAFANVF
jgi:hypothetical protein